MTSGNGFAAQANQWMEKISDLMSSPDKGLDKTEASIKNDLDKLKLGVEIEKTAAGTYRHAEKEFREDLSEIGIHGAKQNEYVTLFKATWDKHELNKKLQDKEALASTELNFVNDFIQDLSNLPKLKEIIDSAEPEAKWQSWLKGITGKIPGMENFMDDYFGPVMEALGIGWLVSPKKKESEKKEEEKPKTAGADKDNKAPEKNDEKNETPSKTPSEDTKKAPAEGPLNGPDTVPENFKPGATCLVGDSNYAGFKKEQLEKMNIKGRLTKGSMQSSWGASQVEAQEKDYFKQFEYVVIGFGTNDIGSEKSADKIWKGFERMIARIKVDNPQAKILLSTIPPGKGNKCGLWGSNFDKDENSVESKRKTLHKKMTDAKDEGLITDVIDLAKTKAEGGVASNDDPQSLATEYRRFKNDKVHINEDALTTAIRRAQYKTSNK